MQRLVQLALDLFDPPAAAAPAPQAPALGEASTKPKMPSAPDGQALVAPKTIVNRPAAPAVPLPSLLSPAEFRHPQANRELLLGDAVVAYALQRARRRSIGFTVGADGLSVRAPSWVTLGAVDSALREKSDWILRKLGEARERQQRMEGGRIVWAHGAVLPYLGEPLTVVLDPSHGFAGKGGALVTATDHPSLHIGLPHSASPAQIRDAVQAWLMRDARRHFTERLDHFAPLLGVRWASLRLSSANTRWGSAKADGSIRLNWRLLHYRPAIIDYVVAHELAHLRVMDHSPRFWDTVATVVPDYAQLRSLLRDEPAPLWD
jgi:predicted metal-dependent hydrolase